MTSRCTQVATSSAFVKETASITWVLNDFKKLTCYEESPTFSPPSNPSLAFGLGIWIKSYPFVDNVFIYLYPQQTNQKLSLEYEVSILDSHKKKLYTRMFQCSYDNNFHYPYSFASLISYSALTYGRGFIIDDKLTLFCKVNTLYLDSDGPMPIPKLIKDFQDILESGDLSDFSFLVGGKEFKVHKAVLAARSEVFKEMFNDDLAGKKQNRVEISDIDVEVFEQLLAYIYSGDAQKIDEFVLELFVAADKYQLNELKWQCVQLLLSSVTIETAANLLLHADMHSAPELKSKCIKLITTNSIQVMATDGWKQFLVSNRMQLLTELFSGLAIANSGK